MTVDPGETYEWRVDWRGFNGDPRSRTFDNADEAYAWLNSATTGWGDQEAALFQRKVEPWQEVDSERKAPR